MKFVQNSSNVATNVFIFKAVKLEPLHPGFNAKATLPSSSSVSYKYNNFGSLDHFHWCSVHLMVSLFYFFFILPDCHSLFQTINVDVSASYLLIDSYLE